VRAHGLAAFGMLLVSLGFGYHAAHGLSAPGPVAGSQWFTWGKMRYDHTQGILFGWLANAFFAFLYHAVPVLTGRAVRSAALGRWLFGLWNFAVVVPGWVLVLMGISQPLEWAEFPLITDAFVLLCFALAAVQFLPAFFAKGLAGLYVSSWYILGGLVFTLLSYPMGNLVPELLPGAQGALFSGLWIHDAIGLFVTPLALAIIYYVIPAATGRPLYSHFLSMLGFWLLFFLYPLNGTHHYVYSVIPMSAQMGAIAASTLLGLDVVLVVVNLLLSLRGAGIFPRDPALRFVSTGTVFYLLVSLQGSVQAQMPVNKLLHFSDWVVGHSHLAMAGFATFAALGGLLHAWQRTPGLRFHARWINTGYWLLLAGLVVMVADLTVAGLVEARLWERGAPWMESVRAARPYWSLRTWMVLPIAGGFVALLTGLLTGVRHTESPGTVPVPVAAQLEPGTGRALSMAYWVASVAGVAFFALSVVLLGLAPAQVLDKQVARQAPANVLKLTAAEMRGRRVYSREGCAYCHTQQVRYAAADVERFGAATLAWETQLEFPHLWGTRRIGPDLAREGGTRSADWQLAHLYNAAAVTPGTVMPDFKHLFRGDARRPRQEALDVLAYLETLGRAREWAAPEGEQKARAQASGDGETRRLAFPDELNRHPAKARSGPVPVLNPNASAQRGQQLIDIYCAGCHTSAPPPLNPAPADLAAHDYTLTGLAQLLWNGRRGTAMGAWRDLSVDDLSAIAVHLSQRPRQPNPAIPAPTLALGRRVYAAHCAQCHGENGAGDGSARGQFPVDATNFHTQRPSLALALRAIRQGVPGTPMAPWARKLTEPELNAVAFYVRTWFEE
jgi:cytochrome c oxidase cbb3-type subunit I/II